MLTIKGERINLKFAQSKDRRQIFEMLISEETVEFMFNSDHPAPTWEEFLEENESYYTGSPSKTGSYLLIVFENEIIGSISYASEYVKIPYAEFDIWLKSKKYLGKGLGTEAIMELMKFVHDQFNITDFLIRPWIKNQNAIKAYKKCGVVESSDLSIEDYYSENSMYEYGDGDYGIDETVNLFLKYKNL